VNASFHTQDNTCDVRADGMRAPRLNRACCGAGGVGGQPEVVRVPNIDDSLVKVPVVGNAVESC